MQGWFAGRGRGSRRGVVHSAIVRWLFERARETWLRGVMRAMTDLPLGVLMRTGWP